MKNLLALAIMLLTFSFANAQDITGVWKTFDDETGDAKSFVKIYEKDGKYYGEIVGIVDESKQDAVCDLCKGELKDQKIIGLTIINGLKKVNNEKYSKGSILDPKKGKEYKLSIYPESDDKLKLRGYIGIEAAGRTQYWERSK